MLGDNEVALIRHAPVAEPGRLFGRTDAAANVPDVTTLARALSGAAHRITSPALRCRQTAAALWPGVNLPSDSRLWEQDFGAWDGCAFSDLPDLGPLDAADLAVHRPPDGESFVEVCARIRPVLEALTGGTPTAMVVHAGVIRAALAHVLGAPETGLAFEVPTLSLTRLRALGGGRFSIVCVATVLS